MEGHQDVRRLDVAMDDAFLMGVLYRSANLDEQFEPLPRIEPPLVAELGDRNAANQFHDEVGVAAVRRTGVEHLGDVRVVHQFEGLPLGLEAAQHLAAVHAGLDHLQRHLAADGRFLLGNKHAAHTAFANQLAQFVRADLGAWLFERSAFDGG